MTFLALGIESIDLQATQRLLRSYRNLRLSLLRNMEFSAYYNVGMKSENNSIDDFPHDTAWSF